MKNRRIIFTFERGGEIRGILKFDEAPETCSTIWNLLPLEAYVLHTRWCGREINFPIKTPQSPPRENEQIFVSKGDIVYWREWEGLYAKTGAEALAIYYGAEHTRDCRGNLPVNIIGNVDYEDLNVLKEIGIRIWQKGGEKVTVTKKE
ncbi:MAG: DUF3830 family protein [Tepidanaerobacteraceae bacterium]|jgi:hypothetical protein